MRAVCTYLSFKVIPELVKNLKDGEVDFSINNKLLSQLLHKRGVNIRYFEKITTLSKEKGPRIQALNIIYKREMISKSFKHIVNRYLRLLPALFASACITHLLNCLLGAGYNSNPRVKINKEMRELYLVSDILFEKITISLWKAGIKI